MFIKTISNSKHETFKQCQLKYKYRYVDKLPEPEAANTDALQFGSYIHKVLEDGVRCKTVAELIEISNEVRGSYRINESYDGKDIICFENFIKFNSQLEDVGETESQFEVDLDLKGELTLNGIIDRVIKGKEGGYLIIDYKTSKKEKTKVDLYMDPQLQGYVYAASKMYNVPFDKVVAAHFYPLTGNFVHVKYNAGQINKHVRKLIDDAWKIRKKKKNDFRASRNEFCNWCAYKSACPEFNSPDKVEKVVCELKEKKKRLDEEKKSTDSGK